MNKFKKTLLGTALAGAVIVGAGAGTYSWFTASYEASGTVTNHTLEIKDKETGATSSNLIFNDLLAPSRSVNADQITIKNSGSLEQNLRAKLELQTLDENNNVVNDLDKSKYTVTAVIKSGGYTETITGTIQDIENIFAGGKWVPTIDGVGPFAVGAEATIDVTVALSADADNKFQGKKLKGTLTIQGKQTDAGSQF